MMITPAVLVHTRCRSHRASAASYIVRKCSNYSSLADRKKALYDRIIRVDHAGEFGADKIYAGQMAVLGRTSVGPVIKDMWEQEKDHLKAFEELIPQHRARPSALLPVWHFAGLAIGAGSALFGKRMAMACTVAVESVITEHYNNQIRELLSLQNALDERAIKLNTKEAVAEAETNRKLLQVIRKCRDDEQHHHDTGIEHEAEKAPLYDVASKLMMAGCWAAVWTAERI